MTTSEKPTHEHQGTSGTRPDEIDVPEPPVDIQLAGQLRNLEEALRNTFTGCMTVVDAADLKAVIDSIREQEHRACWLTTCKSCAGLWDKVYEYDIERQWRSTGLQYFLEEAQTTIDWRKGGMRPATDISIFAHSPLSTAIKVVRDAKHFLGEPTETPIDG